MRTDNPTPRPSALARVRAEYHRARRRFKAQSTALRWSLGLGAAAALVALAYAATGTSTPAGGYVGSGHRFPADDLITIRRAFGAKNLAHRVDEEKRVEVAADRLDEANALVAKLGVGGRSINEIKREAIEASPWESLSNRDERRQESVNDELAEMIRRKEGIVDAKVRINRPRSQGGRRPGRAASAFVYVETADGRELSLDAIESIQALIAGAVAEVKPDDVTVFDDKLRPYLDPRDPTAVEQARNRRRREEIRQEILDKLDWLKGVQVNVQLVDPPSVVPVAAPLPVAAATPEPVQAPAPAPPAMSINQPLELPLESEEPAASVAATPSLPPPPAPAPAAEAEPPARPKARVWVKVPRSCYMRMLRNREPSADDLQTLRERTERMIKTAVTLVVPPDRLLEDTVIDTIPDEAPAESPAAPREPTDSRRVTWWWVPAGVAGGAAAVVLTVAFSVLASRRPALRPAPRSRDDHGRYKIDEASDPGPGPSERVRELIRLNPEAAASVLHRWTGQGGNLG